MWHIDPAICAEGAALAKASLRNMLMFANRFLAEKYPETISTCTLKVGDITIFVRRHAAELSFGTG